MRLREEFELFGNVRPVNTIVPGRYENIDLVLIRENLGGFYVAHEFYIRRATIRTRRPSAPA